MEQEQTVSSRVEPVPPAPQAPKIKNSLVLIMSILLIVTVAIAGLFYFQIQKLSKELSKYQIGASPAPTATPDPTANWKTYTNDKYGYTVKIPPDWKEVEHSPNLENMSEFKLSDSQTNFIGIQAIEKKNGIEEEIIGSLPFPDPQRLTATIKHPTKGLSVRFISRTDKTTFDQILSTFKFLETTSQNDKDLTKEECAQQGGLWQKWGKLNQEYCQIPASDAGKSCTDGSQCSMKSCVAVNDKIPGECQTYKAIFGCNKFVTNGVIDDSKTICVD